MNIPECVRRAVTFANPDRTPVDLWTLPAAWQRYGDQLHEFLCLFNPENGRRASVPRPTEIKNSLCELIRK
ncbi:MAG: hypothetical protein RML36_09720 [Anaerolineae bacterium]|nr:hypothetical protein [Anaerolineae bacterium]MDW8099743.1 hypothetical protein [Anaerolineae bacterium]